MRMYLYYGHMGLIMADTIDLTPSPEAYIMMLRIIAEESTQESHRKWAMRQLVALGEFE